MPITWRLILKIADKNFLVLSDFSRVVCYSFKKINNFSILASNLIFLVVRPSKNCNSKNSLTSKNLYSLITHKKCHPPKVWVNRGSTVSNIQIKSNQTKPNQYMHEIPPQPANSSPYHARLSPGVQWQVVNTATEEKEALSATPRHG